MTQATATTELSAVHSPNPEREQAQYVGYGPGLDGLAVVGRGDSSPTAAKSYNATQLAAMASGACVRCLRRPAKPGRKCCAECSAAMTADSLAMRKAYFDAGICIYCYDQPNDGRHKGCSGCLKVIREAAAEKRHAKLVA